MDNASPGEPVELSIVLPVFQEEANIGGLIEGLVETLASDGRSFEIVAVDDGSTDGTLDQLREMRERHACVRVARHLTNRGNGASLRTGIRASRGTVVVTMDADGQHRPEDIARLLGPIPPYDLVIGARTGAYRGPFLRGLANQFYNAFAGWLVARKVDDLTSGFRAMRRAAVVHFLPLFPEGFSAPTTTTLSFIKAGYNVTFVPIDVQPRSSGQSKIRLWSDGARFIRLILRMIMLYDPLRIFLPVGGLFLILGFMAWVAGLFVAHRLVLPNSAILLFSSSLITWLLGLLSDQIANTRVHYHGDEALILVDESAPAGSDGAQFS